MSSHGVKKRKRKQAPLEETTADEEDLRPLIEYYWRLGFNDPMIATHCLDHFNRTSYGLSAKTVQRQRKELQLSGVRQQQATFESITPFYQDIRERFPTMGARNMVSLLRQDYSIKVSERFMNRFFKEIEPDALRQRRAFRFKRKRYWSAGIMDVWCFDQHDKWKRFVLWPHLGIDPYSGKIQWLKIWWTNRNPRLVTSYYIQAGRKVGGIPLITQSDPGGENYGIANCHTVARQRLDPTLEGTMQHRWMNKKAMNVKPEATWSQLRRRFTPGFESILEFGVSQGLYDISKPLEKLVFRWLAIPWLQAELDAWRARYNSTPRRQDKNKILPQGIPDLIVAKPHLYGTEDYKVIVSPEMFDETEQEWAPPDDPVFELTPPIFTKKIVEIYENLGRPAVSSRNFWNVYSNLLDSIIDVEEELTSAIQDLDAEFEASIELLPDKPLREGANVVAGYEYYGGLAVPPPLDKDDDEGSDGAGEDPRHFADLTDVESS
ncbi:hypothetical protein DFH07DRAFT_872378 [Mycena maculata]|uniref:Integrase core domain-containing protein n=1 Tax=Mycena maculata TaxID=230809 RepID=A0AAD7HEG2_9AGAR|nr:hypothetical protein DFH07DRAFT_872378 [Mycena maculata]